MSNYIDAEDAARRLLAEHDARDRIPYRGTPRASHRSQRTVEPQRQTIPDIAAALGVRPNTVSSYRSRGQMPAPTGYVGRTPWWSPADIEPWIEQQRANRRHVGRS